MKLQELKEALYSKELPKSIKPNAYSEITDVPKFIENHISFLEANSGNKNFKPYYDRLVELLNIL